MTWHAGDRVQVQLPINKRMRWVPGTVREIDPPDQRPGVLVDLDYSVNGLNDCFATHAELKAVTE